MNYEELMISTPVFVMLIVQLVFALVLPVGAVIYWKKRADMSLKPVFLGAAFYVVFSMVVEQFIHTLVLGLNPALAAAILSHPIVYAVYAGLVVGVMEESGRLLAFKAFMRQDITREHSISFGLGFAGLECILVLAMTMASYLMIASTVNSMGAEAFIAQYPAEQAASIAETIRQINVLDVPAAILVCLERLCTMVLHVELSVLVFAAVRLQKMWLYPVAMVMHTGVGFIAALYQSGVLPSAYMFTGFLLVYVVLLFFYVRPIYRRMPADRGMELDHFGRVIHR